ncbi:MAG: zinc metallopeptidase [Eubacteriales bacterium]|jgi:Zn-dependent membrane protease YugP|nr:zinc metallopeptidase [Clostridiales bacterium]
MYFDWTYVFFVLPTLLLALWAQFNVKSTYTKYASQPNYARLTGREAAQLVLMQHGITGVNIRYIEGDALTNYFDPRSNEIVLSRSVYDSSSVSAIGIAAHEAGHAVQYAQSYAPMKVRAAIIPVTQIGSNLAFPLVLLGIIFSFYPLTYAGLLLFSTVVIFQLVTLPVEYNASTRALESLRATSRFSPEDLGGVSSVLRAAALTYLAALAVSVGNMARLITLANRRRK